MYFKAKLLSLSFLLSKQIINEYYQDWCKNLSPPSYFTMNTFYSWVISEMTNHLWSWHFNFCIFSIKWHQPHLNHVLRLINYRYFEWSDCQCIMCICLIFEGTSPLQINYKHHFTDKLPSFSCPDSWYLQLQLTLILTKASHIKHFAKFNTNLQIWARSEHQTSCLVNQMNMLQIFCKKGYKSKPSKLIFWLKLYSI